MEESLPGPGIKPLVSLRSHKRLALGCGILVFLLGAPIAWIKGTPKFQAEATVQVSPRYMKNLRDDQELVMESNTQYRQFVQHQIHSIVRFDVLQAALNDPNNAAARQVWQRPTESPRRAIERLQAALVVRPVPDTYLIRVALEGDKPQGLDTVVNAVMKAYLTKSHEEQLFNADVRTEALSEREQQLLNKIRENVSQRNAIARDLNLTSFSENIGNPFDKLVADQRHGLDGARQQRITAEAALQAFQQRGDTHINVRSVQDNVLNDPGLNSLKSNLYNRYGDLTTQMSGLRPEHPAYAAAVQEKAEIEQEIRAQDRLLENRVRANILARLQATAEQAQVIEKGLEKELQTLESRSSNYAALFQQALTYTNEIDQARKEVEQIRDRMSFFQVEGSSPGFLRSVSPARPAEMPLGTGRKKLLLLVLLASLASAVVAPLVADLLDRRVRTVNTAQSLMGIPAAGWQLDVSAPASELFAEEQRRRMAAALIRFQQREGQRIFGFCGIKPGAGCTTLIFSLAQTLQQLGFKTLVVEANGFRPDARYHGAAANLLQVLQGQHPADMAVNPASAHLPARVAYGAGQDTAGAPPNQGRQFSLDGLQKQLQAWSQDVDFLLVDMPPLLVSADAELLLTRMGHVLLVLEAGASTRGEILRARRMLQALDPEAVGFILNRVRPFQGGGYLNSLLVEHVSQRKHSDVMTLPAWKLWWTRLLAN